jgi:hypothetical protein
MEKSDSLNIKSLHGYTKTGEKRMDLGAYFQTLQYVLMASTFVALVLVFLYMFHGKEDEAAEKA